MSDRSRHTGRHQAELEGAGTGASVHRSGATHGQGVPAPADAAGAPRPRSRIR